MQIFLIQNGIIIQWYIMDRFTQLFWMFFLLFIILSVFLLCCTKRSNVFYFQIACGIGMFIMSKIGRNYLGFG